MYSYNPTKLQEVRIVKGLSREDVASGAGVSVVTIYSIEKGKMPHLKSLIAVVNFLKISITDVIEFDQEVPVDKSPQEALNEVNPNNE